MGYANCFHFTGKKKPMTRKRRNKKVRQKRVHKNKYSNERR